MIPQSLGVLCCEIKVAEEGLLTNQIQILNVFDSALFCLSLTQHSSIYSMSEYSDIILN